MRKEHLQDTAIFRTIETHMRTGGSYGRGSGPTWHHRGAAGPASAWGQGSAPISPLARSGKCWRITRGEPHLPPRAPCRTNRAYTRTPPRSYTDCARRGTCLIGAVAVETPASGLPTTSHNHTALFYSNQNTTGEQPKSPPFSLSRSLLEIVLWTGHSIFRLKLRQVQNSTNLLTEGKFSLFWVWVFWTLWVRGRL